MGTTETQRIIKEYYNQLYSNNWTTQKKWTNLRINVPRLNHEEVESVIDQTLVKRLKQ